MKIWISHPGFVQLISAVGIGALLGAAAVLFSPLLIIIGILTIFLLILIFHRPEISLLLILTATSSIIFENVLPMVHIGIGSLHLTDVLLLVMLGFILIRGIVEPGFKLIRTPLDIPILCFYGIALFSTFYAILHGSVSRVLALRETRTITYFLSFFIVTNLVRTKAQLKLLVSGIIFLGAIVAFAMIAQYLLGTSVQLFPGRIEVYSADNAQFSGVTRILPPGQSLVFLNFIILVTLLLVDKSHSRSMVWFPLTMLVGIGVILTFNRNFWGGICIALALLVILIRKTQSKRLVVWFIAVALLVSSIVMIVPTVTSLGKNNTIAAVATRFSTLFNVGTLNESSLRFRTREDNYAISKIMQSPIIGIGLGAMYRPWDSNLDWGPVNGDHDLRNYIHNGHLGLIIYTGFFGYACFSLFSALFIWRGLKFWEKIQDTQEQAIFLAMVLAYMGIFVAAIVNPVFQQSFWTPVFGIMMATNEVIIKINMDRSLRPIELEN
jgi:hypothetical protein